ncbi:MAG: lysophospholipid acyltransferase family protein [Betaproteobacteria bacterium]|nr:lysophospholipid acyltransferase family protein [Betaproteobacteria bacterium]
MLIRLLRVVAKLPLSWIHLAGATLGWLVYLVSPSYAFRLRDNLFQSRLWRDEADYQRLLHENIAENGKASTELIAAWFRPVPDAIKLIVSCEAAHLVEEAQRRGKGILFLTPHLGCFDIAALWFAQRIPITVLYRPPRMKMLQPLIEAGRGRDKVMLAPANLSGVRLLLKGLKRGESLGILPDQVPSFGEGVWTQFFGRPAYTMTLVGRLVEATGATPIIFIAERLPRGRGYVLRFAKIDEALDRENGPRVLNAAIEKMVRLKPGQYLWSYNRYKVPAGAPPPDASAAAKDAQG